MIVVILMFIAGISKSIKDVIDHHYSNSFFSYYNPKYWNPSVSWKNKWKVDENNNVIYPKQERFFLSSTLLVALTDAWHLFDLIMIVTMVSAIFIYEPFFCYYIDFIINLATILITFHLFYHHIWR